MIESIQNILPIESTERKPLSKNNKTGLQPVSRPVEQSHGFFRKVPNKRCQKTVQRVQEIFHKGAGRRKTCFQTSGNIFTNICYWIS